jgi:ubiquitin-protein ligase
MSFALMRINREYGYLMTNSSNYWSLRPKEDIFTWEGNIHNLDDPRHVGKNYSLEIVFAENHPFKPPKVRFTSPIECENVYPDGEICIDVLNDAWSPAILLHQIMFSICSVLTDAPVTGLSHKPIPAPKKRRRTEVELLQA